MLWKQVKSVLTIQHVLVCLIIVSDKTDDI